MDNPLKLWISEQNITGKRKEADLAEYLAIPWNVQIKAEKVKIWCKTECLIELWKPSEKDGCSSGDNHNNLGDLGLENSSRRRTTTIEERIPHRNPCVLRGFKHIEGSVVKSWDASAFQVSVGIAEPLTKRSSCPTTSPFLRSALAIPVDQLLSVNRLSSLLQMEDE
ncbi:hypothetical protein OSB04_027147 [Centaurea solstitialis]|uniref:Uncharacterized protein n=1 Tax=Centaurea solstitialis TaxID=347529 RepID=A0AA38SQB4_9ASTR|nr:hypothetical protein OSB04_027147 [Centaurea solstitialis]